MSNDHPITFPGFGNILNLCVRELVAPRVCRGVFQFPPLLDWQEISALWCYIIILLNNKAHSSIFLSSLIARIIKGSAELLSGSLVCGLSEAGERVSKGAATESLYAASACRQRLLNSHMIPVSVIPLTKWMSWQNTSVPSSYSKTAWNIQ